jgi:hypothetical protein
MCYVEESRPPLWSSGQSSWLHNGDVLCFLWGTNWTYICYVEESRPPLWSSSQSSWLQIQRSGFDSRLYQIFCEVVGLERGPLSLVSTTELLERKSSGSGLENRDYGRRGSAVLTIIVSIFFFYFSFLVPNILLSIFLKCPKCMSFHNGDKPGCTLIQSRQIT